MRTGEPWVEYSRDRLPPGWTYPLRRDDIRQALSFRQAHLDNLALTWLGPRAVEPVPLLSMHWFSDAEPNYFRLPDPERTPLRMMHHAVPAPLGRQIADDLRSAWLDQAAAWAKAAPARGNAWTASDHEWSLTYTAKGGVTLTEN